jgi:HD superfamily phosphohydrolase
MYKYVSTLHLTVIEPKVISRYNPENNYVYFEHVSTAIKSRIGFFFHKLLTKADPKFFDTAKVVSRKKVKTANNTLHFIELDNRYYSRTYMGSLHLLLQMATKVANS